MWEMGGKISLLCDTVNQDLSLEEGNSWKQMVGLIHIQALAEEMQRVKVMEWKELGMLVRKWLKQLTS